MRSLRVFEQYLEENVPKDQLKALKQKTSKIAVEIREQGGKRYKEISQTSVSTSLNLTSDMLSQPTSKAQDVISQMQGSVDDMVLEPHKQRNPRFSRVKPSATS